MIKRCKNFYVYYEINNNNEIDIPSLKIKFNNLPKINLTISLSTISKIRNKL